MNGTGVHLHQDNTVSQVLPESPPISPPGGGLLGLNGIINGHKAVNGTNGNENGLIKMNGNHHNDHDYFLLPPTLKRKTVSDDIVLEYYTNNVIEEPFNLDVGANVELTASESPTRIASSSQTFFNNNNSSKNAKIKYSSPVQTTNGNINFSPTKAARKQTFRTRQFARPMIISSGNPSRPKPPPRTDLPEIKMRLHDKQRFNKRPRGGGQMQNGNGVSNGRGEGTNGRSTNGSSRTLNASPTPNKAQSKPTVLLVQENPKSTTASPKTIRITASRAEVPSSSSSFASNRTSTKIMGKQSSISPLIATAMATACFAPAALKNTKGGQSNLDSTSKNGQQSTVNGKMGNGKTTTKQQASPEPKKTARSQKPTLTPVLRIAKEKQKMHKVASPKTPSFRIATEKKKALKVVLPKTPVAVEPEKEKADEMNNEDVEKEDEKMEDKEKEKDLVQDEEEKQSKQAETQQPSANVKPTNGSTSNGNRRVNPFELQSCRQFEEDEQPFTVRIKADTMALMDLHAHCLKTEVIGLLGGHYCPITQTVNIRTAEPCPSICNDSIKCEIDPVAQALALDKLEAQNFQVVGWYHSHPTFSPDPSNRDIETQTDYQRMFSEMVPVAGQGRPYVAFILSPFMRPEDKDLREKLARAPSGTYTSRQPLQMPEYKRFYSGDKKYAYADFADVSCRYFSRPLNALLASPYRCFWVANVKTNKGGVNESVNGDIQEVPYEMAIDFTRDERLIPLITSRLGPMCQWIARDFPSSVIRLYRPYLRVGSVSVNYLEKVIASLSHILTTVRVSEAEADRIKQECIAILADEFARLATTNERRPSAQ